MDEYYFIHFLYHKIISSDFHYMIQFCFVIDDVTIVCREFYYLYDDSTFYLLHFYPMIKIHMEFERIIIQLRIQIQK